MASRHIHATVVVIGEAGILIQGTPGSGKSSLALRLVAEGQARGRFARLVGDDRIILTEANGQVVARPHPSIAGLIERRALPIAAVPHEPGCVLRLVVDLTTSPLERLPLETIPTIRLLRQVDLPALRLAPRSTDLACLFVLQELGER